MQTFTIDEDFEASWRANGVAVIRQALPIADLEALRAQIVGLFLARFGLPLDDLDQGLRLILTSYETDKDKWRQCANRLSYLPALAHIGGLPSLLALAQRLGLQRPIFSTPPELRIDMPDDEQYRQPWHQDWRYGQASFNSITIWAPLHRIDRQAGPLNVLPGSHLDGLLASEELLNPRRFSIADPQFAPDGQVALEVELGDCIVFSQLTAHCSGKNVSGAPRFSVQIRFADLLDEHFKAQGYTVPKSSPLISERVPEPADMAELFGSAGGSPSPRGARG